MDDGADAHRRPPPPRSSRRRRPPAGSGEDGQEPRFRVAEGGLSPRRSGIRTESRASSFPAPVSYPNGSVGIPSPLTGSSSSSAAPLVDGGPANPDLPTLPHGITLFDPDGGVRGPFTPEELIGHPGTFTRVRQSVLYSDRPRRSRPRRPAPAEEHPAVVSSNVDAELPTFDVLSLTDPPLLTPHTNDDDDTDTDEATPPEPIGFGFGTHGPHNLHYSAYPPRPKWTGGVRGQLVFDDSDASSSEHDDPLIADISTSEKPIEDPDDDTEELRLLEEYFEANPPVSMSEAFDKLRAANHAALTSLAAEWGVEPPPPIPPRRQFLADQAQQKASAAVSHPQRSTVPREPSYRRQASEEEIVENAKKWMRDEVSVLFQNYIGRRDDLKIVDYHLDELCNQCVSVENYHKIFHHYNFTVKLKKADSDDWIGALYFAEVKQMLGRKSYFCCALEPNENGLCYACQNQGVDDLRHPATGGFDKGWPNVNFGLCYLDD